MGNESSVKSSADGFQSLMEKPTPGKIREFFEQEADRHGVPVQDLIEGYRISTGSDCPKALKELAAQNLTSSHDIDHLWELAELWKVSEKCFNKWRTQTGRSMS